MKTGAGPEYASADPAVRASNSEACTIAGRTRSLQILRCKGPTLPRLQGSGSPPNQRVSGVRGPRRAVGAADYRPVRDGDQVASLVQLKTKRPAHVSLFFDCLIDMSSESRLAALLVRSLSCIFFLYIDY